MRHILSLATLSTLGNVFTSSKALGDLVIRLGILLNTRLVLVWY